MRPVALVAVALAGCGRVAFDPMLDAPSVPDEQNLCPVTTHDEDGDLRDDSCDVCPHVPDPGQADLDGDGVGNACDPETGNPRQRIILFDPFTTLAPDWVTFGGSSRIENDAVVLEGLGGYRALRRVVAPQHDVFQIGAVTGAAGAGRHIVSLVTPPSTSPGSFYCEMFDDGAQPRTMFTYTFDDTNYMHDGTATWTTRLANGAGTFEYQLTPSSTRCQSVWNGETRTALGTPKPQLTPERFVIYAENVDVRVEYVIQIRTTP